MNPFLPSAARCAAALLSLASVAGAQTPEAVASEGQAVPGMGAITLFSDLVVGDDSLVFLIDTDAPSPFTDGAIMRNGLVEVREGKPLSRPAGATLDDWRSVDVNRKGILATAVRVKPVVPGVFDGAMWGSTVVAYHDDVISSPFLGAGSAWDFMMWAAAGDDEMFVSGFVRNPALARTREGTVVRYDLDPQGNVVGEEVLATEGMSLPALGIVVRSVGNAPTIELGQSSFDCNRHGEFISFIRGLDDDHIALDYETSIARTGQPSVVPGRAWGDFFNTRVAINDLGETAYTGNLEAQGPGDPTTWVLVKNGAKLVQSGDLLPGFQPGPLPVQNSAFTPIVLCNTGDLFWRADGDNDAILRNTTVVLQENVTMINGKPLTLLRNNEIQAFSASPDGRFLAAFGTVGAKDVVITVDFGLALPLVGCAGNPGTLATIAGRPAVGESLTFSMDRGNAPGALARIVFSTRAALPGSDCGRVGPFGEVFTSRAHRVGTLFLPPWDGSNPTTGTARIPNDLALFDSEFFAQGSFRSSGTTDVSLTNGLRIEIGAP